MEKKHRKNHSNICPRNKNMSKEWLNCGINKERERERLRRSKLFLLITKQILKL